MWGPGTLPRQRMATMAADTDIVGQVLVQTLLLGPSLYLNPAHTRSTRGGLKEATGQPMPPTRFTMLMGRLQLI